MVNPKWAGLKLAEIARFLAQIARNPARKNTVKYCVFTISALLKTNINQCITP
jgi:hypothetical protein